MPFQFLWIYHCFLTFNTVAVSKTNDVTVALSCLHADSNSACKISRYLTPTSISAGTKSNNTQRRKISTGITFKRDTFQFKIFQCCRACKSSRPLEISWRPPGGGRAHRLRTTDQIPRTKFSCLCCFCCWKCIDYVQARRKNLPAGGPKTRRGQKTERGSHF